jgi:hypothetical protein
MGGGEAYSCPGMGSRRVSARRTLAVAAAATTLPVLGAYAVWGIAEDEPVLIALAGALIAAVVAAAVSARRRWLVVAAGALLVSGGVLAIAGGLVLWPGAALFAVAAAVRGEARWRLGRVLWAAGGVVGACALAVAVVLVVVDIRDDPDLEVHLRAGAAAGAQRAVEERALRDPRVSSVGSSYPGPSGLQVEVEEGTPEADRDRLAAALRRDPRVAFVRVVD